MNQEHRWSPRWSPRCDAEYTETSSVPDEEFSLFFSRTVFRMYGLFIVVLIVRPRSGDKLVVENRAFQPRALHITFYTKR